jgi:hypothetical protein
MVLVSCAAALNPAVNEESCVHAAGAGNDGAGGSGDQRAW